jgi:hypothetical protein
MRTITLIKCDGNRTVLPIDTKLSLKQMQDYVGGNIQMVNLPDGRIIIMNEEGRDTLPLNLEAGRIWLKNYPLDKFPVNNPGTIFGDVLLQSKHLIKAR